VDWQNELLVGVKGYWPTVTLATEKVKMNYEYRKKVSQKDLIAAVDQANP